MKLRCAQCRQYVERDEALRFGISSYCNEDCKDTAMAERRRKGAARLTTQRRRAARNPLPPELRDEVVAADGGRCRGGWCQGGTALHCHHILYRSEGGKHERGNLLTLCPTCHDKVHSNKRLFQPMAMQVALLRDLQGDRMTTIASLEWRNEQHRQVP